MSLRGKTDRESNMQVMQIADPFSFLFAICEQRTKALSLGYETAQRDAPPGYGDFDETGKPPG